MSEQILPGARPERSPVFSAHGKIQSTADNGFGVSCLGVMSKAYKLSDALKLKHVH